MRRYILKKLWTYIARQLQDVAIILSRRWAKELPPTIDELRVDLAAALKHVLYHGRPPEEPMRQ